MAQPAEAPARPSDLPPVPSAFEAPPGLFDDDEPGERWRALPEVADPADLLVSNFGNFRSRGKRQRGQYEQKTRGCLHADGYYKIGVNRRQLGIRKSRNFPAHRLVCLAFRGAAPIEGHTVDHFDGETKNNRLDNLWWRSKKEQRANTRKRKPQRTAKACEVQKVGADTWLRYTSVQDAAKALSTLTGKRVQVGHMSELCSGKHAHRYGYRARFVEQVSTGIFPLCNGDEQWAFAVGCSGATSSRVQVSTHARARTKTPVGDYWSDVFTPQVEGRVYPRIEVNGAGESLHIVIWRTFRPDRPIDFKSGETIDHIDRDKSNARLENLRPFSKSEQALNQARRPREAINNSRKSPVWGLPPGSDVAAAREYLGASIHEAAETLSSRLGKKCFATNVCQSLQHGWKCCGWQVFATSTAAADAAMEEQHARCRAWLNSLSPLQTTPLAVAAPARAVDSDTDPDDE